MNNALEPSLPQAGRGAHSEDSAEAAQRDLFNFLATCEAMAPPLVADAVPPPEVVSGIKAAPSVAEFLRVPDGSHGTVSGHDAHPSSGDRDAETCEGAARSAAEAVDEVTRENLRRLEA